MPDGKACHLAAFFPMSFGNFLNITNNRNMSHFNVSDLKIKILISSCSFHF